MKVKLALSLLAASAVFAQGPTTVNEYVTPNGGSTFAAANTITKGPDGNVWFTDQASDPNSSLGLYEVGRVTPSGNIEEFDLPAVLVAGILTAVPPNGITAGSDGALWFGGQQGVGRITTDGKTVNSYILPSGGTANWLTLGSDGNVWFTEATYVGAPPQTIGYITPQGKITEFIPPFASAPNQIVSGPDGALWWADNNGYIGRVTTSGQFSQYVLPPPYTDLKDNQFSALFGIAAGPDGNLWFTSSGDAANNVAPFAGKLTPAGQFTIYNDTVNPDNTAPYITVGPDGSFWLSYQSNILGRITTAGVFSSYSYANVFSSDAITVGGDGALWFPDGGDSSIGQAVFPFGLTCFAGAGTETHPYFGQCTAANGTAPYAYSVSAGSLPPGVSINATFGALSGTPTGAGTYTATVQVKDSKGRTATQQITIVIAPPSALSLSCSFTGSPQDGVAYSGGCSASGGTSPYTYSVSSGSLPPGLTLNSTTGTVSGTPSKSGAFTFTIEVKDSESPAVTASQTETLAVSAPKLVLTCSIPAGLGFGLPVTNAGCAATFGNPPYSYSISTGSLPTGVTLDKNKGTLSGAPTALGAYTFTVQATDSSSPVETAASQQTVTVQIGSGAGVTFTINGVPQVATPFQNITGLTLQLSEAAGVTLPATLSLQFADGALIQNYPGSATTYTDPAMQFVSSSNAPLGLTYNFTIPAAATSVALPNIDAGTVAGGITINLAVGGTNITQAVATIPGNSAPIAESGSVQITNVTSGGFDVELNGVSPDREVEYVTFTFNPAPNAQIIGTTSFTYNVTDLLNSWYTSTASAKYGSEFALAMPFQLNGQISAIQSVTVTLTNLNGTSTAVTGTR